MNGIIQWSPGVTLDAIEKQVILTAFRFYRGNKTATASALGIAVRTLDNKLEKYEADGKAEKERLSNEQQHRSDWLTKQRGIVGRQVVTIPDGSPNAHATTTEGDRTRAAAGVRVESPAQSAAQPPVSLSERKEVQSVLPKQAAQGGARKSR